MPAAAPSSAAVSRPAAVPATCAPSGAAPAARAIAGRRRSCLRAGSAALLSGMLSALLGACAGSSPEDPAQPAALRLDLQIDAAEGVNPDAYGRPAPILLRIYQLRSREPFATVDYFLLAADEVSALDGTLLRQREVVLRPGQSLRLRCAAAPGTRALGVSAAYRDLPQAAWRASRDVPRSATHWWSAVLPTPVLRARIRLDARQVRIEAVD